MSLKAELLRWAQALEAYDAHDYESALAHFNVIADSSKVLFNIGLVHATLGNHEVAVDCYKQANLLDQYLAVSFFQSGVSNFLLAKYQAAQSDFENAELHMRENQIIDYDQLGLKFRLFSAEILFNKALSLINQGQQMKGMETLDRARKEKQTEEHNIIDEAYQEYGQGFTVFSVPVGVLFRPPPIKLKNLKAKNYLGQAKLVAATEATDAFIGFSGLGVSKTSKPASIREDVDELALEGEPARSSIDDAGSGRPIPPLSVTRNRSQSTNTIDDKYSKLRGPKSVPDLREADKTQGSSPPRLLAGGDSIPAPSYDGTGRFQYNTRRRPSLPQNPMLASLPRIDTNVGPAAGGTQKSNNQSVVPASPSGYNGVGALLMHDNGRVRTNAAEPLTPPDSDPGRGSPAHNGRSTRSRNDGDSPEQRKQHRPTSSETALDYMATQGVTSQNTIKRHQHSLDMGRRRADERNTAFVEKLLDGYSLPGGEVVLNGPKVFQPSYIKAAASPNAIKLLDSGHQPTPQGQPVERVQNWANTQQLRPTEQDHQRLSPVVRSAGPTPNDPLSRLRRNLTQLSATSDSRISDRSSNAGGSVRMTGMVSFRLKLHYEGDVRGMSLDVDTPYSVFISKVQTKFGPPSAAASFRMKYLDEDGVFVSLLDEDDWNSAIDAARVHCPNGRQDGKLEVWVDKIERGGGGEGW